MDINDVQLVGGPCGQHGPYTFYKAFQYTKHGVKKIITLSEFFFVKMWRDSDLVCISELQLLWTDKNSEQTLASLRLYFLPENTPEGRMDQGEDEVLAISEKVVIRLEDLITWITSETQWTWGRLAKCEEDLKDLTVDPDQLACPRKPAGNSFTLSETIMDFSDVEQERDKYENSSTSESHVIILSFPKYCRYRAMMRRLEGVENLYLKFKIVNALGGFYVKHPNTRVLFCRDTFDYPELEGHELLCNHLAPKLKGRPRGKRKKRSVSPGSESNESESSITNHFYRLNERSNGVCPNSSVATRRSTRCHENNENKQFMKVLSAFMKAKRLPMGRIPSLGYKELNLHEFYTRVQKLGGYECVTTNRLWKSIFDDMTGHLNSTSAATIIRRHYERFLLAFERYEKGEEDKPFPTERRRLKNEQDAPQDGDTTDSESGTDTPSTSRSSSSPAAGPENNKELSSSGKTSSLRSIRVKPERQKDKDKGQDDNPNKPELNAANQSTDDALPHVVVKTEMKGEPFKLETSPPPMEKDECVEEDVMKIKVEVKIDEETDDEVAKITLLDDMIALKEDEKPTKSEPDEIKPSIPEGTKTAEGSNPLMEPVTSAVAPVAITTTILEKNLSPIEGKENIPLIKMEEVMDTFTHNEIITSESAIIVQDVKKIKLDILKEGGLEVTPVRSSLSSTGSTTPNSINNNKASASEFRPSVIQPPPSHHNFAKPASATLPPLTSNVLPKRNLASASALPSSVVQITQVVKTAPVTPIKHSTSSKPADSSYHQQLQQQQQQQQFINGTTPPKVVQSKSIYSYSEKTVYGNPKDFLQPSALAPPKAMVSNVMRHISGGDPVDLSLTSPQKPAIEIMPLPQSFVASNPHHRPSYNNRASVTRNLYKTTPPPPLLDGRKLGPNLEITLVGPKPPHHQRHHSKRSGSETYAQKIAKLKSSDELNSRHSSSSSAKYNNIPPLHKSGADIPSSSSSSSSVPPTSSPLFVKSNSASVNNNSAKPPPDIINTIRQQVQKPSSIAAPIPQTMPPYLASRFAAPDANPTNIPNGLNPYLPLMDSLYYQAALQNVYSNLSNMPPMLPIPTPEQLKFYAELMAHGRLNMPYSHHHPADGHPSSMGGGGSKKP